MPPPTSRLEGRFFSGKLHASPSRIQIWVQMRMQMQLQRWSLSSCKRGRNHKWSCIIFSAVVTTNGETCLGDKAPTIMFKCFGRRRLE